MHNKKERGREGLNPTVSKNKSSEIKTHTFGKITLKTNKQINKKFDERTELLQSGETSFFGMDGDHRMTKTINSSLTLELNTSPYKDLT